MVDEDGGDGLGLGLACLDIGGEDLVAGLELADRDSDAGGEQDFRISGEGLPAAGRSCIGEVDAVFCGKACVLSGNSFLRVAPIAEGVNSLNT